MSDDLNFLMRARRDKLERLRAAGVEPYAYAFDRTHTARDGFDHPAGATRGRRRGRRCA